jgi:hypothetical protein
MLRAVENEAIVRKIDIDTDEEQPLPPFDALCEATV